MTYDDLAKMTNDDLVNLLLPGLPLKPRQVFKSPEAVKADRRRAAQSRAIIDAEPACPAFEVDSEFRALIPPMTSDELTQLERNVNDSGGIVRDPLAVWNGLLLDGHHRYDLARKQGWKYRTIEIDLPDRSAAKAWIIRNQLGRRNLTPYQRAELALALEPEIAAHAKANQREHGGTAPGKSLRTKSTEVNTRKTLAKAARVSADTMRKVKLLAAAPDVVKEQLRAGETTINREYRKLTATQESDMDADVYRRALLYLVRGRARFRQVPHLANIFETAIAAIEKERPSLAL
jgi:hypothetical protein